MWTLAHEQGIALPVKDYWEFDGLVTVSDPRGVDELTALDQIYKWTELIRSSPLAVGRWVHAAIGGASLARDHDAGAPLQPDEAEPGRRARPRPHHRRHDPGARPREPRVLPGARRADPDDGPDIHRRQNAIIVEKAIRYAPRGIVGIDIAGPRPDGAGPYPYRELLPLIEQAREAGLGMTIHVGEEGGEFGIAEIREVVSTLRPDRIGHRILAAQDTKLMDQLREAEIVLEICPTSNLLTKALESEDESGTPSAPSPSTRCRSRSPRTARR